MEVKAKHQLSQSYCHPHLHYDDSRCIVLVSLSEDAKVVDKWLEAEHHPLHPGHPSLEEPDQLVDVVPRDLLGLVQQEH